VFRQFRQRSNVDLPPPLGPIRATVSPGSISRLTASKIKFAPYIFKDPKDPSHNIGFEVDLAEALSRELGRPIVFKQYQFGSLVSGLERGDFDFAMNGLEVTPDRRAKLLFSRPYYLYQQQLVVRGDESRIKSFEDLKKLPGIQVGTMEDTAALRILEQEGIPAKIYDNQVEPYTDLELGRIDAVLLDLPIAVSYARPWPASPPAGSISD
jgi:polar amino acid transport system substrate-binding protein